MQLIFAHPAGWFALLGWPLLVLIHCLQRQSRRVEINTLFLLERQDVESRAGRRLDRWRNSRLFWLQMLAVLLLAWMLSGPRWIIAGSLQHIALVLDSSLSMEAFRPDLQAGLARDTGALSRSAAMTDWLLLESDPTRAPLYHGEDRNALLAALSRWTPNLGPHDAAPALRSARAAVGNDGLVFFVTDRAPEENTLPALTLPLAYGHVLDNVGVAAASAEKHEGQPLWRALVRNYSTTTQKRTWWLEAGGQRTPPQTLELAPDQTVALQGAFPEGADRIVLALEPDAFATDDRAPLVLPQAKSLHLAVAGPEDFVHLVEPLTRMFEGVQSSTKASDADLLFSLGSAPTAPPPLNQIFFSAAATTTSQLIHARPAADPDPLMEGLNFSGLIFQPAPVLTPKPEDTTLLWDGATPLIFVHPQSGGGRTLVFNIDPRHSNLLRLSAFALLVDRFAEEVRRMKAAAERANYLAGQPLHLLMPAQAHGARLETTALASKDDATNAPAIITELTAATLNQARAPSPPAFFRVTVDGQPWLDGATQFPDPRESDFHDVTKIPLDATAQAVREQSHSQPDSLTPLWLLLLLGTLLASWRAASFS